jgi:hypothetical protein
MMSVSSVGLRDPVQAVLPGGLLERGALPPQLDGLMGEVMVEVQASVDSDEVDEQGIGVPSRRSISLKFRAK